jgi:hypothetical protein
VRPGFFQGSSSAPTWKHVTGAGVEIPHAAAGLSPDGCTCFCGRARDATVLDGAKTAYVASSRTHFTFPAALARTHSRPSVRPPRWVTGVRWPEQWRVRTRGGAREHNVQVESICCCFYGGVFTWPARGRSKVAVAGGR